MIVSLLGGLGIFLLGMVLLTEGLKSLAGDALRGILTRFVAGPISGVGWGAFVTALVQSSTATTLTTVGFVSAGLLTFQQSVGVIFGANIGTTSTGWIVSQLGFKVSIGSIAPPLVLVGVAMRLLFSGRATYAGTALAGFGLLFMGIDLLSDGMAVLAQRISPEDLPGGTGMWPRLLLLGFGFLLTVIMQSSSASMTTTLAAVASGAIGLDQAAAMVIGQNIGTTVTAIAAGFSGPAASRRTALAHVMFNVLTAGVAFFLLPWMLRGAIGLAGSLGASDAPTVLATFHTMFNFLGIAILLPVIAPFSRFIERLIPERAPRSTRFLTPAVADVGPVALEAARRSLASIVGESARDIDGLVDRQIDNEAILQELSRFQSDLAQVRAFVFRIGRGQLQASEVRRQAALLHATDHCSRLLHTLRDIPTGMIRHDRDPVVAKACSMLESIVEPLADACIASSTLQARELESQPHRMINAQEANAEKISNEIAQLRKAERRLAIEDAAAGKIDPEMSMSRVDALLWIDRTAYHLWRAVHYLRESPPTDLDGDSDAQGPEPAAPGNGT